MTIEIIWNQYISQRRAWDVNTGTLRVICGWKQEYMLTDDSKLKDVLWGFIVERMIKRLNSHGTFKPGRFCGCVSQSVFIHDPICLSPSGRATCIKNQSFFHSYAVWSARANYRPVCTSGLPISWSCCSVWSQSIWVLSVSGAKEIPFILPKQCLFCTYQSKIF